VGDDVPIDSKSLLVTDFMNLKMKPTQSFGCAHTGRICVHMFIGINTYIYKYLYLYCISKKI
jgi:hypothetical protein